MTTTLDMTPYYAEALSYPPFIREDIDNIYKLHKEEFYIYAKESEHYNSPIAKEGSLLREEYFKKSLGILMFINKNDSDRAYEIQNMLYNVFKKGYKKSYAFFKNMPKDVIIDMKDFLHFLRPTIVKASDEALNGFVTAGIFFALCHGEISRNIINIDDILLLLNERTMHYNGYRRFTGVNKIEQRNEINEIMKQIPRGILSQIFSSEEKYESPYHFLYDVEKLSLSILEDIKLEKKIWRKLYILTYLVKSTMVMIYLS
jgi:hypothetical protein